MSTEEWFEAAGWHQLAAQEATMGNIRLLVTFLEGVCAAVVGSAIQIRNAPLNGQAEASVWLAGAGLVLTILLVRYVLDQPNLLEHALNAQVAPTDVIVEVRKAILQAALENERQLARYGVWAAMHAGLVLLACFLAVWSAWKT